MAGQHSRNKGKRGEREVAKQIGGERTWWADAIDVLGPDGWAYEVKWWASGLGKLYAAIAQAKEYEHAGQPAVVVAKTDREEWIVAMPLTDYLEYLR